MPLTSSQPPTHEGGWLGGRPTERLWRCGRKSVGARYRNTLVLILVLGSFLKILGIGIGIGIFF